MLLETPKTSDEKVVRSQIEAQSGLCTKGVVSARSFVAVGLGVETEVGVVEVICPRWDVNWGAGSACGEIYTLFWWISQWTPRWIYICCVYLARLEYEGRGIWPRPWYWMGRKIVLGVSRSGRLGIYWAVNFATVDYPGMYSRKAKYL
jgi:hypothetical protein